jgi:hypothetical protein
MIIKPNREMVETERLYIYTYICICNIYYIHIIYVYILYIIYVCVLYIYNTYIHTYVAWAMPLV